MALNLSDIQAAGHLPPELSREVITRATEQSTIAQVAGRADMSIKGTEFVIDRGYVEADIVEEGKPKPVSDFGLNYVRAVPLKAAVIVDWTREARIANPGGVLDRIGDRLSEAIAQQIDAAVLYGKSVKSGADIDGLAHLNQTENRVELGTATAAKGGLTTDFLAGYSAVANEGHDFTGFVADPRLRSDLIGAVDAQGRPVFQSGVSLNASMGSLLGLPVAYGRAVSGRYGRTGADTGVRAFGGDFAGALKLGFVENVSIKTTDTATVGGVSMWETNREAALCEAIFSFVITDLDAFAAYEVAGADAEGE